MGTLFERCSSSGLIQTICSDSDSSLESLRTISHHAAGEKQVKYVNGTWQPCRSKLHYRLLKKLREKDTRQIELEKLEQGFALYLNGANLSRTVNRPQAPPTRKSRRVDSDVCNQPERRRPSKTAGQVYKSLSSDMKINFRVDFCAFGICSPADSNHNTGMEEEANRAKTAPSKRKSWAIDSIELRTEDGDPLHVKAPGNVVDEAFDNCLFRNHINLFLHISLQVY